MKILSFQIWFNRTTWKADITLLVWPSTLISTISWINFSSLAQNKFYWVKKRGWTTLSLATCIVSDTPVHLILKQCIWLSCSQLFSTSNAFSCSQLFLPSDACSQWAGVLNWCWSSIDQNWQPKNTDDMSLIAFLRLLWAFSLTKHASMTRREVMKKANPGGEG